MKLTGEVERVENRNSQLRVTVAHVRRPGQGPNEFQPHASFVISKASLKAFPIGRSVKIAVEPA